LKTTSEYDMGLIPREHVRAARQLTVVMGLCVAKNVELHLL
jgi:hypothetical protein